QPAYQFYLLHEGKVAVESSLSNHPDMMVQVLGAGDALGWSWLFPPFAWHFQARALEPSKAIRLDGARLLVACEQSHELGYEVMTRVAHVVIQRLQATGKCLVETQQRNGLMTESLEPGASALFRKRVVLTTSETALAETPFLCGMRTEHLKLLAEA